MVTQTKHNVKHNPHLDISRPHIAYPQALAKLCLICARAAIQQLKYLLDTSGDAKSTKMDGKCREDVDYELNHRFQKAPRGNLRDELRLGVEEFVDNCKGTLG